MIFSLWREKIEIFEKKIFFQKNIFLDANNHQNILVLRHICPIPQNSILRNCGYQKLRMIDLPQKPPPWYQEKNSKTLIKIVTNTKKIFLELETFSSCCGFRFMTLCGVTWLNLKKKLTPPLWELSQGGVRSKSRKRTAMS